ncbi:MAG: hypothetical protein ACYDG5_07880 [Dehalococcoidales bacterium]
MKRAIFFAIIAAVLLVPCGVAYAYGQVKAADIAASIAPADQSATPTIQIYGNAIGSISAGDLFIIDTSGTPINANFTLTMTNIDDLVKYFRCMTLNVGIYSQTDNVTWQKMTTLNGAQLPEMLVTMQNSSVSFTLTGNARYRVTIEKGNYQSFSIARGQSVAIPRFSLAAGQ